MRIPFVDLRAQHDEVRAELEAAIRGVIDDSAFIGGRRVEDFERAFASYCGVPHAAGVGSGTDALRIGLQVVDVRPGEFVITVPHSFIATVEGITQVGADPLFVDVEPRSYTMDPKGLEALLASECREDGGRGALHVRTGRRVTAVVPVHLYGQSADMEPILGLARRHGLAVVEDAAQAHGATYRFADGRVARCGAMGDVGCFSFYPGKNLGAMGEAGAVVTHGRERWLRARVLRDHGQSERYVHVSPVGSNARLDAVQAAILLVKLGRLEAWNERRRAAARWYEDGLADMAEALPEAMPYGTHVYHLYVIQVDGRDRLRRRLEAAGVGTGLHYPIPLHLQEAYRSLGYARGAYPVAERIAANGLSLPMHPHLTEEQVRYVAEEVRAGMLASA
jgi:dTDP-4-amino-4,6-dideoxygalactose transaminase